MNTIVVPTDFSATSEHAMHYAAALAQKLNASLVLFHTYLMPVTMAETPVLTVSAETLKASADEGLEKAAEALQLSFPELAVQKESRFGDIEAELKDYCETQRPSLIVVGKHDVHGVERWLFGSTSQSLIRKVPVPLIIVPEGFGFAPINQVALGIDHDTTDEAKTMAAAIATRLGAQLHLVHVKGSAKDEAPSAVAGTEVVVAEEFDEGIHQYIEANHIDLLVFVPHHHNFVERLFFNTHTASIVKKGWVPVMCLPEA